MAIDPQTNRDVNDTRVLIQDTLLSVGAKISESIKNSIQDAVDGVDATVLQRLSKSITNNFTSLARAADDAANNTFKINEGLLTSRDVQKQLLTLAEKQAALGRLKALAQLQGIKYNEEDYNATLESIEAQKKLLLGEQSRVKEIEQQIGLTGKLISAISKIPGIGQFLNADEINQEMKKAAATGASKFQTMGVAAKMVGKQLLEGLTDPLTILTAILDGFFRVNKASVELQRLTGQNETAMAGMNDRLATSVQFLETAAELTKQLGFSSTSVFSPDQIAQLAEAKNLLGLSAEQAGRMGLLMKVTNKSVDQIGQGVYDTVNAYNGANRAAINQRMVLDDVLSTSSSITATFSGNERQLGKAATQAAALGINLERVDEIAGSLLNFEDSIGAELEAQLMTGKNINLSRARELALNNDLEGVAKELKKNGASAAEFANMNRLEQESLAKALGMSRDELAKSVLTQQAMNSMTAEQVAKARGVTLEQSKAMDIQEKMQVGMQKLAEAFAPLLDIVVNLVDALMLVITPVANVIAMVSGNPIGKGLILAFVAAKFLGVAVSGVGTAFGSMYQLGAKAITGLTGLFKQGRLQEALGGLRERLAGGFKGAGPIAPPTPAGGKGGQVGSNMLGGLSKIKSTDLLKGAGAILILSGAMFVAAKAFKEFEGVDFKQVALGVGTIGALAAIAMVLGKATPAIVEGAFAVAILSASLIPLGFALNLAAPGIQAFGTVVTAAFGGLATLITAVADGFVKILGAVTMENIGPMLLLGPALFGIAAGLSAVSLAGLLALPAIGGLVLLSKAAPALVSLGIGGESKSAGEVRGKEEGTMAALEAKFDTLIALVQQGTTISLDGSKIATSVSRNLPKVQISGA